MSHEIKTHAANRVWGLLVSDKADDIDEEDIRAIEQEAAALNADRLDRAVTYLGEVRPWLFDRAKGAPNEGKVLAAEILTLLEEGGPPNG